MHFSHMTKLQQVLVTAKAVLATAATTLMARSCLAAWLYMSMVRHLGVSSQKFLVQALVHFPVSVGAGT